VSVDERRAQADDGGRVDAVLLGRALTGAVLRQCQHDPAIVPADRVVVDLSGFRKLLEQRLHLRGSAELCLALYPQRIRRLRRRKAK